MKLLVYTVSDFKPFSLECIKLMLSCFSKINFDFKIITNNADYLSYKDVIYDDFKLSPYVGFLKYSKNIPDGYDAYLYLDSDILFFGNAFDLFSEKEYSCVIEDLPITNEWFFYKNSEEDYLQNCRSLNGFNAGTFLFKNLNFLKQIRDSYEPHITQNVHFDARLEQSSFNYILSKNIKFDIENVFNLTKITQLFASEKSYQEDKKIYHFCGFSNEMQSKFFKMKMFYDSIKR